MTEKPNSVCAECKRPENYVGHTRYAMDYHPFEPVAEPAEPSASPQHINNQTLDTRVVDRLESALEDAKAAAAQPAAGEGPLNLATGELALYRKLASLSSIDTTINIRLLMELLETISKLRTREGTPKLEEIKAELVRVIRDYFDKPNYVKNDPLLPVIEPILRPFIPPACSPEKLFIGDLRRELFMPYDCKWNGYIRDLTAELEKSEMVSRSEVHARINKKAAELMAALEFVKSLANPACQCFYCKFYGQEHCKKHATPASTGEANGWISVEEHGLPKAGQWCWVVCNGVVQRMAAQLEGKGFASADGYEWQWALDEADPAPVEAVTHWQPLTPAPTSVPQAEPPKCEACDDKGVVLDKETQLVVDCPECDNPDLERQGDTATPEELGRGIVCFPCQTENICKAFKRCQTLRDLAAPAEPKGETK